jgi:hypothetical protein
VCPHRLSRGSSGVDLGTLIFVSGLNIGEKVDLIYK